MRGVVGRGAMMMGWWRYDMMYPINMYFLVRVNMFHRVVRARSVRQDRYSYIALASRSPGNICHSRFSSKNDDYVCSCLSKK